MDILYKYNHYFWNLKIYVKKIFNMLNLQNNIER